MEFQPTIKYILANQPTRDPNYEEGVCAVFYQSKGCGSSGFVIDFNFTTDVGETILTVSVIDFLVNMNTQKMHSSFNVCLLS